MVKQYPYTLKVLRETESQYDENTGEFTPATSEWIEVSKCRDEGNGGGNKIVTTDGQVYVYGGVIYLPKNCPAIGKGENIQVVDADGNIRMKGATVQFRKEQMHARLWV